MGNGLANKKVRLYLLLLGIFLFFGAGVMWLLFYKPHLTSQYTLLDNAPRLEFKENLPKFYKSQFLNATCDGNSFLGEEMDVIATDKSESYILNNYETFATNDGLSFQKSEYGIADENLVSYYFESRCFAGKFNKNQPAFFFAIIDYNKNAKLFNSYFTYIPPTTICIVILLRGFINYI